MSGAPELDPIAELLARTRRLEIRSNAFMRWNGFIPGQEGINTADARVLVDNGELHCNSPAVTVGDALRIANDHRLSGDVPLYLSGRCIGSLFIEEK